MFQKNNLMAIYCCNCVLVADRLTILDIEFGVLVMRTYNGLTYNRLTILEFIFEP